MSETTTTQHDVILASIKQAQRNGFQNAVDGLREMADMLNDEDDAELVKMLATALESMKP